MDVKVCVCSFILSFISEDLETHLTKTTITLKEADSWKEELPPRLKAMRIQKRKLRKLWAHSRCPRLKRELNSLTEKLSHEVKAWRATVWEDNIAQVSEDQANLYNLNCWLRPEFLNDPLQPLEAEKTPGHDGITNTVLKQMLAREFICLIRL